MKIMKPHFLINQAELIDRHTEPRYGTLNQGDIVPAKNEELTITLTFVGSGNTTKIPSVYIITEIMERLEKIE